MAQTNMTIRLNDADKSQFYSICERIGLSASTAINVFIKAVIKEERIPFELSAKKDNDFYNQTNIQYLEKQAKLYKDGKINIVKKSLDELGSD